MEDRRISEKYRKPRRAKGTPFYHQRNYFALSVLAAGGLCWYLYELTPYAKRLKQRIRDGEFDNPEHLQRRIEAIQASRSNSAYEDVLLKARERLI